MMELAPPEIAEVVGGIESFKSTANCMGRQALRKQLNGGSHQRKVIPINLPNKPIGRADFSHFSLIMPIKFCYQPLVAVCGNLGGKFPVVDDILSSHEQEIYPTASLDQTAQSLSFKRAKTITLI